MLQVYVNVAICDVAHYNDFIMGAMASQITSLTIAYPIVYSGTDKKQQSSASPAMPGHMTMLTSWPFEAAMGLLSDT